MLDFNFKTSLVDLAQQYTRLRFSNNEWRGCCPLHNGSDETAFVIFKDGGKERWKCFSGDCGSGDIVDFYKILKGCDFLTAYKELGGDTQPDPQEAARIMLERSKRAEKELEEKIKQAQEALEDLRKTQSWLRYNENLETNPDARRIWRSKGIPDNWQDIFQLGYNPSFRVAVSDGYWTTPTITIPIFDAGRELINVRHRLLNPFKPTDKYRPDRPGLQSAPFMCDPDEGWELDHVLVCEGEIKAAVTYITLDSPKWQVIGIPGKTWKGNLIEKLKGHQVWICLDPDATDKAKELAKETKGRIIRMPIKIDDAINQGIINKSELRLMIKNARSD